MRTLAEEDDSIIQGVRFLPTGLTDLWLDCILHLANSADVKPAAIAANWETILEVAEDARTR